MKSILTVIALTLALTSFSQDLIVRTSNDTLSGMIVGLTEESIYLKTDSGRVSFPKETVQSFRHMDNWYFASGEKMTEESLMLNKKVAESTKQFGDYLYDAGSTLQVGMAVSILFAVAGLVVDNPDIAIAFGGISALSFCATIIITGSKLKLASHTYKH